MKKIQIQKIGNNDWKVNVRRLSDRRKQYEVNQERKKEIIGMWKILWLFILAWLVCWVLVGWCAVNSQRVLSETVDAFEEKEPIEQLIEIAPEIQEYIESEPECDILCRSAEFVTKYEWFSEKPYWDAKRYSIGYGTPANWRQGITQEQAMQEVKDRLFVTIRELQYHIDDEWMIVALASFKYNVWSYPSGWKWYIENWHISGLKNRMKEYVYSNWKKLGWLVKRRNAETELF